MKSGILSFAAMIAACLTVTYSCQDSNIPDDSAGEGQDEIHGGDTQPGTHEFYSLVTEDTYDWSGDYLIAYAGDESIKVFGDWDSSAYGQPASKDGEELDFSIFMEENGIPAENGDPYRSVIEKTGGHYSINVTGVGYIGYVSGKNTLARTDSKPDGEDDEYLWDISYRNGYAFLCSTNAPERRLQWNSSAPRFSTYTGSQNEISLFRKGSGNTDPGPEPEPDPEPEPEPEPEPGHDAAGWYELPAVTDADADGIDDNDRTLYYASHMCAGGEKYGHNGKPARNYTVCYSSKHHCPVWVAAPRHAMYESGASRTDAYGKDPDIPAEIQYNSKSTGGGCNKGHMLGSAERLSSTATNRQVFYYTNIAPQLSSTFNTGGGAWNNLEDYVDGLVCRDTLYEVVGCYFETYTDAYGKSCTPQTISFGGRSDVTRPSMFYYVLLRTRNGNSGKALNECSTSELQCAAFVLRHNMEKGHKPQRKDMMSVSDLEKITGFTYFTNVPAAPKDTFDASDWGL